MKKFIKGFFLLLFIGVPLMLGALIFSSSSSKSVNESNPSVCAVKPGTLPNEVPEKLSAVFTAAAAEYDVPAHAVALVYFIENRGYVDPPPPYGDGNPWRISKDGALGPFQHMPNTYFAYRNSNPANQPGDPLDLTDAAYATAHYLKDAGIDTGSSFGDRSNLQKGTVLWALAAYHSGRYFKSLGPAGREYVEIAEEEYNRTYKDAGNSAATAGLVALCNQPSGSAWRKPLSQMNLGGGYGSRVHPIRGYRKLHDGSDFPASEGTPLYAMSSGVVTKTGFNGAIGYHVNIDYGDNQVVSYQHMPKQAPVAVGQSVKAGDKVGEVGNTGYSTGAHLHLSWFDKGEPIDPVPELCARGIVPDSVNTNSRRSASAAKELLADCKAQAAAVPRAPDLTAATSLTSLGTCPAGTSVGNALTARGEVISLCKINGMVVNAEIASIWQQLVAMARADGINLTGSGFRSAEQQIAVRKANCGSSYYAIYEAPSSYCRPYTAPPGTSLHEKGNAVDLNNASSYNDQVYLWMKVHAPNLGIYAKTPGEPWHWSTTGG